MKRIVFLFSLIMLLETQACRNLSRPDSQVSPTPEALGNSIFTGRAIVDSNGNGRHNPTDEPLENAMFSVAGFNAFTDSSGIAKVVIPGGWDGPLTAQMSAPEDSGYTLLGPTETILQNGLRTSAIFLFAPPSSSPSGSFDFYPRPGTVKIDLTYCVVEDDVALKMDLFYPFTMREPLPVVVYIHGGGWTSGDKSDGVGTFFLPALRRRGYLVVAINYRLAPMFTFPAMIEDAKCAIRHLRANAERYHLDPDRIGALGGSAGGHLVSLLGLTDESAGWDVGSYPEQSSRVSAVVNLFGPTDLTKGRTNAESLLDERVFGVKNRDDPLLAAYSPISYITPDDPPFLIIQGEEDDLVLPIQAQMLTERLESAGVPVTLVMVENAGHGLQPVEGSINPTLIELIRKVVAFFNSNL